MGATDRSRLANTPMKIVRRLGSQFMAFLSGAILATGLAILAGTMLTDQRPVDFGLLLLGGLLVGFGGVISGWISVISGDVEALEAHESDAAEKDAVWEAERRRLQGLLLLGLLITLAGLAMLPLRLSLTGWPRAQSANGPRPATVAASRSHHAGKDSSECVGGRRR